MGPGCGNYVGKLCNDMDKLLIVIKFPSTRLFGDMIFLFLVHPFSLLYVKVPDLGLYHPLSGTGHTTYILVIPQVLIWLYTNKVQIQFFKGHYLVCFTVMYIFNLLVPVIQFIGIPQSS
jgi:hypothetical protein